MILSGILIVPQTRLKYILKLLFTPVLLLQMTASINSEWNLFLILLSTIAQISFQFD